MNNIICVCQQNFTEKMEIYLILYICQSSISKHTQSHDNSAAAVPNDLIHVFTKPANLESM